MRLIYGVLSIIIFVIVVIVFLNFIYIENFTNYSDSLFTNNIDNNILKFSNPLNEDVDKHLYNKLLNIDSAFKSIKYLEGVSWEQWKTGISNGIQITHKNKLQKVLDESDINSTIIYCKLNKKSQGSTHKQLSLIDSDVVIYNKGKCYADHVKILYVYDISSENVDIINCILIGKISENDIYMKTSLTNDRNYSKFEQNDFMYGGDIITIEDNIDEITSHDLQVQKLLYNKLMKSHESVSDDLKRNIEYTNNQNIVRKHFLNNMLNNTQAINHNNIYKNYPYGEDFSIK